MATTTARRPPKLVALLLRNISLTTLVLTWLVLRVIGLLGVDFD